MQNTIGESVLRRLDNLLERARHKINLHSASSQYRLSSCGAITSESRAACGVCRPEVNAR
jgi:hypothetical protein